jgi:hypothetical protein
MSFKAFMEKICRGQREEQAAREEQEMAEKKAALEAYQQLLKVLRRQEIEAWYAFCEREEEDGCAPLV